MKRIQTRSTGDEGQAIILFALFAFVLLGALALALDVGYLLSERREAQAAADASALAGARALLGGESTTGVVTAAQKYAASNGLPSTPGSGMSVNVEGDRWDGEVTVDLTVDVQKFFLGALYTGNWAVSAHAVAEISDKANARYIIQAHQEPGISIDGGIKLTAKEGSIISNYNIDTSGDSNIVITDGFIDAAGTIEYSSGWVAPWGIRERRAPAPDPFEDYEPPVKPTGPAITGNLRCKLNGYEDPTIYGTDCHFWPGYYHNANIKIWDPTLWEPGLYYFENTSIEMIGNSAADMVGIGVNFYFTGNPNQSIFKPGIGSAYLTAPGWNPDPDRVEIHHDYRDMVIWYDMCPGPELNSSGNQLFFLGGVTYAPCSDVYLHGNPYGDTISGMLIAGTVTIKGASDTGVSYLPYAPAPSYEIYLIE